jgi:hypothetical protein
MPFAPATTDQSGQILAQGIMTAANAFGNQFAKNKEQERADKEKAKQESDARARLLKIADALSLPGAEHMSTAELSGVIDAETLKHARTIQQQEEARANTRLGLDVAQANRADRAMTQTDTAMARAAQDNAAATAALQGATATPAAIRRPGAALNLYTGQGGTDFATAQKLMETDRLLQGSTSLRPPTYQNVGPGVAVVDPGTGKPQVVQLPTPQREPAATPTGGTHATLEEAATAAQALAQKLNIGTNRLRTLYDEKTGRFYNTIGGDSRPSEAGLLDVAQKEAAYNNSPEGQADAALKEATKLETDRPWFNADTKIHTAKVIANAAARAAGRALPYPGLDEKTVKETPSTKAQAPKETKAPAAGDPASKFGGF